MDRQHQDLARCGIDPDRVRDLLQCAGFTSMHFDDVRQPFFGADADTAYDFLLGLAGWMPTVSTRREGSSATRAAPDH